MLIQVEEIKELTRIPFIILSTKGDMLLLTGEAKYKLVLEDSSVEDFLDAKFQNMLQNDDSLLNNYVTLIAGDECNTSGIDSPQIKNLAKIPQATN